jgi:hypothetical protein
MKKFIITLLFLLMSSIVSASNIKDIVIEGNEEGVCGNHLNVFRYKH